VRESRMLRSTRRGLETWHGRDVVTLADERASQRGIRTSTYTGAPVLDPTCERLGAKFPGSTRPIDLSGSMLEAEESILRAANAVGNVATGEALKRFDADGDPIMVDGP
jgi:hypothetical protein